MKKITFLAALAAAFLFASCNDDQNTPNTKTSASGTEKEQASVPKEQAHPVPAYPDYPMQTDDSILRKHPASLNAKLIKVARAMDADKKLQRISHSDEYRSKELLFTLAGKKYSFMTNLDGGDLAYMEISCVDDKTQESYHWQVLPDSPYVVKEFQYANNRARLFSDTTECPVTKDETAGCTSIPMSPEHKEKYQRMKEKTRLYNEACLRYVVAKYDM